MPTPRQSESQDEFVSRCIPVVLEDGTAQDQDQAVAVCHSMWEKAMSNVTININDAQPLTIEEEGPDEDKAVWSTAKVNDLPDSCFLYVEKGEKDGEGKTKPRSKRHFPYKDASGKVDLPHLRNAIARIPQSNAPGLTTEKKKSLQARARKMLEGQNKEQTLFERAVDALKAVFEPEEKEPTKDNSGMMFWKEADGTYRWIARYSNNFRDEDNPPEIIASQSHRHFVDMVDSKEAEPPELWLWHVEDWKWGQANWVAYDDSGFALAGGTVDKGYEPLAESLMALGPDTLRVSHGMPKQSVKRDPDDPSIIVEHITREISPLPAWAAANQLTGFILSKEATMAIPDEKREALQEEWNIAPDLLGSLEAANAAEAEEAKDAGIEQKEKKDSDESTEEQPAPEATEETAEPQPLTRDELGQVVAAIGQHLTNVNQQLQALAGEVKEIKETREAKDAETLTDLFQRAVGHEQAKVDGRTSLAKSAPKETEPDDQKDVVVDTGNPLVDGIVNQLVTGAAWDAFREGQEVQ